MFEVISIYNFYSSLKSHYFSKNYDAFKYNFQIKLSKDSFEKRNDKSLFYLIQKKNLSKQQLIDFFVSFFSTYGKLHLSEMIEKDEVYFNFKNLIDNIDDFFKKDLGTIKDIFGERAGKPILFYQYLYEGLNKESIIILNILSKDKLFKKWEQYDDSFLKKLLPLFRKHQIYLINRIKIKNCKDIFLKWLNSK